MVKAVLEVCQPIGIEASLEVLNGSRAEEDRKRRALELAMERARSDLERVRRQYDAIDPTNRLVAAELEARWDTALVQLAEAEGALTWAWVLPFAGGRKSSFLDCHRRFESLSRTRCVLGPKTIRPNSRLPKAE